MKSYFQLPNSSLKAGVLTFLFIIFHKAEHAAPACKSEDYFRDNLYSLMDLLIPAFNVTLL